MRKIYLDANATTRTDDRVTEAMLPFFGGIYGNPSSVHAFGREARKHVEEARRKVASLLGASSSDEIIFTSGGTESDNFAVKGVASALQSKGRHIITSSVEHMAVINSCKALEKSGYEVTYLKVDGYGLVDPGELEKSIRKDTILITVMAANNETGTVMPVKEIGAIARKNNIVFHVDAVQAIGKTPFNAQEALCDLASVSAHKLHGPKGVGALYVKARTKLTSFQDGGHQEKGLRSGTLNVPGIVGFGKACELAEKEGIGEHIKIGELRDALYKGIRGKIKQVRLNGHPEKRLPNTLNVTFDYLEGESILLSLDLEGIAASTGSACTSGSLEPSHVLKSMGVEPLFAQGSVRFSLDKYCNQDDIEYVLEKLPPIIERLRKMSPVYREK